MGSAFASIQSISANLLHRDSTLFAGGVSDHFPKKLEIREKSLYLPAATLALIHSLDSFFTQLTATVLSGKVPYMKKPAIAVLFVALVLGGLCTIVPALRMCVADTAVPSTDDA